MHNIDLYIWDKEAHDKTDSTSFLLDPKENSYRYQFLRIKDIVFKKDNYCYVYFGEDGLDLIHGIVFKGAYNILKKNLLLSRKDPKITTIAELRTFTGLSLREAAFTISAVKYYMAIEDLKRALEKALDKHDT